MSSQLDSVTFADLFESFDEAAMQRGLAYANQRRVFLGRVEDDTLHARVQGSASRPYDVSVRVDPSRSGARRACSGTCSCPIGFNCKHAAAVLIAWITVARDRKREPATANAVGTELDYRVTHWLGEVQLALDDARPVVDATPAEYVVYVFPLAPVDPYTSTRRMPFEAHVVQRRRDGSVRAVRAATAETLAAGNARAVSAADTVIGVLLRETSTSVRARAATYDALMRAVLASGRATHGAADGPALALGPERRARLVWSPDGEGRQRPGIASDGRALHVLVGAVPWYLDAEAALVGPIDCGMPGERLALVLGAPPIASRDIVRVRARLGRLLPSGHDNELPVAPESPTRLEPPAIVARLHAPSHATQTPYCSLAFRYADASGGARDEAAEFAAAAELEAAGLAPHRMAAWRAGAASAFDCERARDPAAAWTRFCHETVPTLRAAGWEVSVDDAFPYRVVALDDADAWQTHVSETSAGWFDLGIDIEVEGKRYALLPIVGDLLRAGRLDAEGAGEAPVLVRLKDGPTLALPRERVRAIARTLVEVGERDGLTRDGRLRVPAPRAGIVDRLAETSGLSWRSPEALQTLASRLASFRGIDATPVPQTFAGELRPYQRAGLDWLQFLRAFGFGGILADDMGLGKSVQTLAHLLHEKESGRLSSPALLVVPTSLVFNWIDEARRFAPSLRVLSLHGPDRALRFEAIARHDLVITTYALLPRDGVLSDAAWHSVVFDEAQMLKNPSSKAWQTAAALTATHRLCLTGTPLENHLGDLWSRFALTMPGALGDRAAFGRLFRTPIEKRGDAERGAELAARIRPFVLRRTKEHVARELPEKTEIVRRVELAGAQRDLYESVRVAMHARVRDEIERLGVAKSQIVVLDALLKLRQVCCDPRLLPERLRAAAPSAKLELLDDMLSSLVDEGRRVLVFSQFTSMLALIAERLEARAIGFELLTGETKHRAEVVGRFQAGLAPVFLISLKAGGTGLNLTAADTVVHYDPWWNPAVERQATDRAHRIGQAKNVFVYKLIGAGTVEERILDLQARKADLARSIYDASGAPSGMTSGDIERLFAPLVTA